jgi:hypothetical protein
MRLEGELQIHQIPFTLGKDSLYESTFYQEHLEICDCFFDILLHTPDTEDVIGENLKPVTDDATLFAIAISTLIFMYVC